MRLIRRPKASEVLTAYLTQCNEPPWTSYFIRFKDVRNDQWGMSNFNWTLSTGTNYHILRTGCFPYMKYHCTKRPLEDLSMENGFFRTLKIINLGIPLLFYGMAAIFLIRHTELSRQREMSDSQQAQRRNMTISVTILGCALLTVLFAYFVFGDSNDQEGLATIRLIGIIYRHGDRSPTELYENDPHANHKWPGGLGALSEKGSLQMLNLGKNLRLRYYRLLPPNGLYTKENMFVLSSAAERCLMSGASFLAGFMPPLENQNLLPISWQPIPITLLPRDRDDLLAQKKACPKYDQLLKNLYNNETTTPEMQMLNAKYDGLYKYLTKHTGQNISNVLDVELLYNILEIQRDAGLQLPEWTEDVFPDKMYFLAERSLALLTETPFMKKVKGGALLTDILDKMLLKRSHKLSPDRSIFIYSAHDITLVNLMRAIGIESQTSQKPNYAATLVLELHHSVTFDDDFEVKIVYYFNSEDKFPKEVNIPNCGYPCSLTQFTKAMEKVTLRNYDESCQLI